MAASAGSSSTRGPRRHSPSNDDIAVRASSFPLPVSQEQHVGFHEGAPGGRDEPPPDEGERTRFVRLAYAQVSWRHPISSDAEVRYQVR
jgi:hypothetical protein